ncbi:MAG TPA: hypothetical protein VGK55_00025 [Actinomycetes bacterium]
MPELVRKSVALSEAELALLAALRQHGSLERSAWRALTGEDPTQMSESAILSELIRMGHKVVIDQVLADGYTELVVMADADDAAYHRAVRAGRRGSSPRRTGAA